MAQRLELENTLLQNTSVMVGRTEIPKWLGQSYDIWMNEIDRWTKNEKSLDKTKYCDVLESLKKNDTVKDYAISLIVERTERLRVFKSILDVMDEKYLKKVDEKTLEVIKSIIENKTD